MQGLNLMAEEGLCLITICYDLFGLFDCWSWVWDIIMGFILHFHLCTICEFTFLHLFVVVTWL